MKGYKRGELIFLRCRVLHDYRSGAPEAPSIHPGKDAGPMERATPDPLIGSSVVVVESCGPSGKLDDASAIYHLDGAHLVSVDEARAAIQAKGARR